MHPLSKAETTQSHQGPWLEQRRGRARSAEQACGLWGDGLELSSGSSSRDRVWQGLGKGSPLFPVWSLPSRRGPAHSLGWEPPMAVGPALRPCPALLAWDSTLWVTACLDPGPSVLSFLSPAAQYFPRIYLSLPCLSTGAKPAAPVDPWGVPTGASTHSVSKGSDPWAAPQQQVPGAGKTADAWAAASATKPVSAAGETSLCPGSESPVGPRAFPSPGSVAWDLWVCLPLLPCHLQPLSPVPQCHKSTVKGELTRPSGPLCLCPKGASRGGLGRLPSGWSFQ